MRLIDADELKNILTVAEYSCVLQNALIGIIDSQPTAYDVDKVVERLKKESYQEFCDSERIVALTDAIEIVKRGGIDD